MARYDVVIVGAGPAGMTAAIYAARANLQVLLVDKLAPGGQIVNTLEIQNYPGMGTLDGAELAIKMFEHTQELGVTFDYGTVIRIENDDDLKKIICQEGHLYQASAVIIATGSKPKMLGIPGEEKYAGMNISWCAICDGAQYKGKKVIVIGGGNSAVEEACYLAGMAAQVTLVTLFDLTADPLSCDKLRTLPNVAIHEHYQITEFIGPDRFQGLRAKSTKTGEEITVSADGAFEYIGFDPSSEGFKELGIINDFGYIRQDENMSTQAAGIFAAGDITCKNLRQVITACSDGAIAAQSVARYIDSKRCHKGGN